MVEMYPKQEDINTIMRAAAIVNAVAICSFLETAMLWDYITTNSPAAIWRYSLRVNCPADFTIQNNAIIQSRQPREPFRDIAGDDEVLRGPQGHSMGNEGAPHQTIAKRLEEETQDTSRQNVRSHYLSMGVHPDLTLEQLLKNPRTGRRELPGNTSGVTWGPGPRGLSEGAHKCVGIFYKPEGFRRKR